MKRVTLSGKLSRAAAMDALMEFDLPIARDRKLADAADALITVEVI